MKALPYLLAYLMLLGGTACDGPRKACRKAEGLMARAVQKCPELMQLQERIDTVVVVVPGAVDSGSTGYTQADMDSVEALCSTLLNRALQQQQRPAAQPTMERVVERMRTHLCDLEPVELRDSVLALKIWTEAGELRYWYQVEPRKATTTVRTVHAQVAAKPCPPAGVASWYRTAFWILASLLLLGLACVVLIVVNAMRHAEHYG